MLLAANDGLVRSLTQGEGDQSHTDTSSGGMYRS